MLDVRSTHVSLLLISLLLTSSGCVLDWSGARPYIAVLDAAPPDAAPPDAPRGDLDAGPDRSLADFPRLMPDVFVPPGPWTDVPAGTFKMGSPSSEPCREVVAFTGKETLHGVTLTHAFELNKYEVITKQYMAVMSYSPFSSPFPALPVVNLSWHEAVSYCNALSDRMGLPRCYHNVGSGESCNLTSGCTATDEVCILATMQCTKYAATSTYAGSKLYSCPGYRLPTEAEWEHAYRANTTSAYYNDKTSDPKVCMTCSELDAAADSIAQYCANSGSYLRPPKTKLPNAWDLYDMAGNAAEWCHDGYMSDLGSAAVVDPVGSATANDKIVRGGNYGDYAALTRAAARSSEPAQDRINGLGLRCARTTDLPAPDAGP